MERIEWIEEYLDEAMRLACDEGHEPALALLGRLLFEEPGYARLHFTLGKVYLYYVEEVVKAERHFRLAIHFDREFPDTYLYLGNLLFDDERYNEAVVVYLQGLNAKRAYKTELYNGAGRSYELMKKYKKAISHYKDALSSSAETYSCLLLENSIRRCERKRK
jgi:tetratricopeptide (TPR) repeat protein